MKKRLLAILLALCLTLALLPTAALAEEPTSGKCGDNATWSLQNGVLTISGTGDMENYSIDDYAPWFNQRETITSVVIKDGITNIGGAAFSYCTSVTDVTIPNSVTSMGGYVFLDCKNLTRIVLPIGITSIGYRAFQGCNNLTNINIPNSVTIINQYAFLGCSSLTHMTIPDSVTGIGEEAFAFCTNLTSVIIGNSVTYIGIWAFEDCTNLTSVVIPNSVTCIVAGTFSRCTGLTDVYYEGNETQWKAIESGDGGNNFRADLTNATIHYNSTGPTQPATPETNTAYASTQNVLVDGKPVEFQAYALKDANGNDTNYVKLRDVAYALNGTAAQFSVGWDAANKSIAVTKGTAYAPDGTEMKTPFSGNRSYKVSTSPVFLDGKQVELEAILLTDDAGNGYTYFKLGNLGEALGFAVNWSADKGIYIETK